MINPNIPLSVNQYQAPSMVDAYGKGLTLRDLNQQSGIRDMQMEQERMKMDEYQQNAPTRNLQRFNERETARLQSVIPAALETSRYLQSGDVPGAAAFLEQRLKSLRQSGIDSSDTEEALQALMRNPESLLDASLKLVDLGTQMGLVQGGAEGFTLSEGQQRFDAMGRPIASVPTAPEKPTSAMREYKLSQEDPGFGEYQQGMRRAGATSVTVGDSGPQVGTIPAGYQLLQGEDGAWQMQPVPGGPAAIEAQKRADAATAQGNQQRRYSDVVTEDIDRALGIVDNSKLPVTGFGSWLSSVPGTPQRDLLGLVDTIRANVGFDRLQQMREASPTGGALGAVSELENRLLQSTLGNLEMSQSKEQFTRNLKRVRSIYDQIVNEGIPEEKAAKLLNESHADTVPPGIDPDVWKFMTDDEKALFL